MNIEEIAQIADIMVSHELTEFQIESDELRLKLKRGGYKSQSVVAAGPAAAPAAAVQVVETAAPAGAPDAENEPENVITSPIVGTFYSAPSPDTPAFVKVGDEVTEDTVVCIIEAMKVMNEIKAECSGVVRKVLVENATPVEFGQPIIELE